VKIMSKMTVKAVSRKGEGGLLVENKARNFRIRIDEPEKQGGSDLGMTPLESLLVALG